MARLERRLARLEEPPGAEVSSRAMAHLSDRELQTIIRWGRRAVAAAEAGSGSARPTPEEEAALARHEALCDDIREGWLR